VAAPDETVLAEQTGWPADAYRPTSALAAGELIRDVRYLTWPATGALSDLRLRLGLYDSADPTALALPDGLNYIETPLLPTPEE
jgi:hypothetical protein